MLSTEFKNTIDLWLTALNQYTFPQLLLKPSPTSWSLGQVYMHLIENTDWFFGQVKTCLSSNENAHQEASAAGKEMLLSNAFPDMRLEGPPDNDFTPQPTSKEEIITALTRQKAEMALLAAQIEAPTHKGKTKHPGLQYFNANEWFQFAEMHLRHHLRQKSRFDEYLQSQNT